MTETGGFTYEQIYYTLWEIARRYSSITQFRVIGKSHDDRMIPMLELGEGEEVIFCVGGVNGMDRLMPSCLLLMVQEYCRAWECSWKLEELYDVRELLSRWRLCFIPVLNPDGYEIYEKDYTVIRNPIYRQMLRMQETPCKEYFCNARGMNLQKNFPTSHYRRYRIAHEPASENETKALVRILQEYQGRGFLSFCQAGKRIVYFRQPQSFVTNQKSTRFARHFQKQSGFHTERFTLDQKPDRNEAAGEGSPERFFAEIMRQPSFRIEFPVVSESSTASSLVSATTEESESLMPSRAEVLLGDTAFKQAYFQIHTIPLEYVFSMGEN